jgi:hypothetical protein
LTRSTRPALAFPNATARDDPGGVGGGGARGVRAKPEGSEAVNHGHRQAPTGHAARVDRNVRRRNPGADVPCVRRTIPDNSGASTWDCKVKLKNHPGAEALVEVITGDGLPYGIAECRSNPAGPNICNLIR